jgi:DNA polymerase sigma
MDMEEERTSVKTSFIRKLHEYIKWKIYDKAELIVTNRLIIITYYNSNRIKVDLNYFGKCSVLNSSLLRVYAQCDIRFSILAINIKKYIKELEICNTDKFKLYLNSFSWMLLLLTFLQDVVNPPVLPKLLQDSNKSIRLIISGNKKKDKEKRNNQKGYQKNICEVMDNSSLKEFEVTSDFMENYENVYLEFKSTNKNEMSLAELFLKFLEFVIFYFKYDSVYANCSFSGECFMNKSMITSYDSKDKFSNIYKGVVNKNKKYSIIIRDPFDHTYNPAQTLHIERATEFINKLKSFYFDILENGL